MVLFTVGCANFKGAVRREAVNDLQCEKLSIGRVAGTTNLWRASGCDKEAVYSCAGCGFGAAWCEKRE